MRVHTSTYCSPTLFVRRSLVRRNQLTLVFAPSRVRFGATTLGQMGWVQQPYSSTWPASRRNFRNRQYPQNILYTMWLLPWLLLDGQLQATLLRSDQTQLAITIAYFAFDSFGWNGFGWRGSPTHGDCHDRQVYMDCSSVSITLTLFTPFPRKLHCDIRSRYPPSLKQTAISNPTCVQPFSR